MSSFQIGPETFLTLRYQVFDAEGEAASEAEVLGLVFGMGQLLPGVERALDGRLQGDNVDVTLKEKEAYGPRDPKRILEIDRADFPPDVSPGDRFEVENEDGGLLVLHVLDVHEDCVVVDTNHPLSGQEVRVHVEVLEVRPAEAEEIEAAAIALEEDAAFRSRGDAAPQELRPQIDVRPEDLIRRPPGRA